MIYLTQLVYINSGKAPTFHAFEDVAIPFIAECGESAPPGEAHQRKA